jgi:hypothetical protein
VNQEAHYAAAEGHLAYASQMSNEARNAPVGSDRYEYCREQEALSLRWAEVHLSAARARKDIGLS